MSKLSINLAIAASLAVAFTGAVAEARPAGKVAVVTSDAFAVRPGATYAWSPINPAIDPRVANDIMQVRLKVAVDRALAAKGLIRVDDPAMATLVVSYRAGVQDQVQTRASPTYQRTICGFRGCATAWTRYGEPAVEIDRFMEGTLVLDLTRRDSGQLVWRSASQKRVTAKDMERARLDAVLADMTHTLPGA